MNGKNGCNMLNFVLVYVTSSEVTRREYNIGGNM